MHVSTACELAGVMRRCGVPDPMIQNMATLADGHPQNQERSLHNWVKHGFDVMPDKHYLSVHLNVGHRSETVQTQIPAVPLHELLHSIWEAGPTQWRVSVLGEGGAEHLTQYWNHVKTLHWSHGHADLHQCDNPGHSFIPGALHEDGCEVHSNTEYYIWSWSSLGAATHTSVDDVKFPIVAIPLRWMRPLPLSFVRAHACLPGLRLLLGVAWRLLMANAHQPTCRRACDVHRMYTHDMGRHDMVPAHTNMKASARRVHALRAQDETSAAESSRRGGEVHQLVSECGSGGHWSHQRFLRPGTSRKFEAASRCEVVRWLEIFAVRLEGRLQITERISPIQRRVFMHKLL